ncbi:outer membrane protein assembly factor BamE [Vibrio sp. D404a]|uniref:outer membrane protein assembly factor BamE domain-containing protein n=1 Tax=unclassified Vibrio TaxID=2614977 RepID=UPI0025525C17|nr:MULTISPECIES: outer membrane protein assembly factor BamE [unclassified Vibrio]MDK9738872.1 outer membrane protein assembly factor BamE [Vibrio sp. D404a]MDK9798353.1 outer membrane protein assembly factor BamE [Vibrio sp. D449a]
MIKKASALLLTVMLTACASQGTKMDNETISKVEKGQTTEQQLITMLGEPTSTGFSSDGSKQLTYTYSSASSNPASFIPFVGFLFSGVDSETQVLYITLDKKGKVSDYTYSEQSTETKTGLL